MHPWRVVLSLGAAVALGGVLVARYAMPDVENVPIERVTANLRRMIEQAPQDVDLRVNIARVHAMAYARLVANVPVFRDGPQAGRAFLGHDPAHRQPERLVSDNPVAASVAAQHLKAAIAAYRDALALDPRHQIAGLGLGWTLIQAGEITQAKAALRRVIADAWPVESAQDSAAHGRSVVEEAAFYLLPLLFDPVGDAKEIATLRQQLGQLQKRSRWITPIAVPLQPGLTALDITDADVGVLFDADGSGIAKRWTWIAPDAAWLVFDRRGRGDVTSALQLFGSVTFWLFWDNGYEALQALDDDGDGTLRGGELRGLALWHDRDSDGVSDAGEVRPLADHGVAALATAFERDACHPDRIAWSPRGVTFTDGSSRPTFDLILRSAGAGTVSVR